MKYSIISYYSGGDLNKEILGDDSIIFTPQEYSNILQELTKGHPVTIVRYNIENIFQELVDEISRLTDNALEVTERLLYPHYVNLAVDNNMPMGDYIVFIGSNFDGRVSDIDFTGIGELKVYLDAPKKYDGELMDNIIKEKKGREYVNGDIIIAHRNLWATLVGGISISESRLRVSGISATLEDLLLILKEQYPSIFGEILWQKKE